MIDDEWSRMYFLLSHFHPCLIICKTKYLKHVFFVQQYASKFIKVFWMVSNGRPIHLVDRRERWADEVNSFKCVNHWMRLGKTREICALLLSTIPVREAKKNNFRQQKPRCSEIRLGNVPVKLATITATPLNKSENSKLMADVTHATRSKVHRRPLKRSETDWNLSRNDQYGNIWI